MLAKIGLQPGLDVKQVFDDTLDAVEYISSDFKSLLLKILDKSQIGISPKPSVLILEPETIPQNVSDSVVIEQKAEISESPGPEISSN